MLSNSHGRDVKAAALIGMPKTITEFQTAMGEGNLAKAMRLVTCKQPTL
jgi:hypothetical protein